MDVKLVTADSDWTEFIARTGYGENAGRIVEYLNSIQPWWSGWVAEPIKRCYVDVGDQTIPTSTAQMTAIAFAKGASKTQFAGKSVVTASEFRSAHKSTKRRVIRSKAADRAFEWWSVIARCVLNAAGYSDCFPSDCPVGFMVVAAWRKVGLSRKKLIQLKYTRPDGDNWIKLIQDAFTKNGLCRVDSQVQQVPVRLYVAGPSFLYFQFARLEK